MDTSKKIIKGAVNGRGFTITSAITQWDYGWQFIPEIEDLPATYRLDFSNEEKHGTALPVYCSTEGAEVPTELIDTGKDVWVWFVRIGDGFGITEYKWRVPNKCKPKTEQDEPTPSQQSSIDQAISVVNDAVAQTAQDVIDADASERMALGYAESAQESARQAQEYSTVAISNANSASQSASQASASATASAQSASQSAQIKADVEDLVDDAQASASASAQSATASANSASQASASATSASQSASSAQGYASQAQTSAQTASSKASEASQSASQASGYAQTAETAKTDAQTAKTQADTARDEAVTAKTAAETAQGKAEDAQAAAESVAESIPSDYSQLSEDVSDLKEDLNEIKPIVTEEVASTNVFTPISTRIYPDSGTAVINEDKSITITNVPRLSNVWIFAQDATEITLEAGDYTLCIDSGLYVYGVNTVSLQVKIGTNAYTDIVSATGEQTPFTLSENTTGLFRINYVATSSGYTTNWSGHIWINKGEAQPYMPVGTRELLPKEFVDADQGEENSGKILSVDNNGKVSLIDNPLETVVSDELYQKGNLLKWDDVAKGYIKADGTVRTYNSLWCSGFCEVEQGNIYCNAVSGSISINQYFAFYDEDKAFLASYQTIGSMQKLTSDIRYLTVPEGAKYFRCTFTVDQAVYRTAWISNRPENPYENDSYNVKNVYPYVVNPENPCDYSELTVRAFSKVVCIGDSLTYGGFNLSNEGSATGETQSSAELSLRYSYPSNFQRITGIETVNAGDSGETSVSWYEAHHNDDFTTYDLAIIFLGVNDSAFSVSDSDTLTAMQNIVTMLNTARSDMRIAVCSCIPAYDGAGYQAKGQLILNWAKGLNDPNIIPLDLAQYSHVRPRTSYVAGHCSALGYYMMALDIARYISWYIDQHKRDFRFIQFIGSPDAVYDYD